MTYRFPFFQKSMLALLGGKDFRHSLIKFFGVLREFLPVEAISFDHFLEDENALFLHYAVTKNGFFAVNGRLPLSSEEVEHVKSSERELPLLLFPDFKDCRGSVARKHSQLLDSYIPFKERGYIVGFLRVEERIIGHLVCMGSEINCFTDEHGRLMELILPACSLAMATMLDMQQINRQNRRILQKQVLMQRGLDMFTHNEMVGAQGGLRQVAESVLRLAGKDTPVLILGETGTGKELVANAIQKQSSRSNKPFIKVNCGALTDTLLDSELFGHEKGAFTSALTTRQGRFEQADGGTLFLDEVGELSPQAQVRLLRVLQDGIFERIGGQRAISVDVRIIAATNRNLQQMCRQGLFREDLYHRLNVFPIEMPPLRERLEDLPLLIHYLAERIAKRLGAPMPAINREGMDKLMSYPWPGNVRELENLVERAFILSAGGPLDIASLIPEIHESKISVEPASTIGQPVKEDLFLNREALDKYINDKIQTIMEKSLNTPNAPDEKVPQCGGQVTMETQIRHALDACNGKVYGPGGAAELLGINHNTLRSRMRTLGIKVRPTYRH